MLQTGEKNRLGFVNVNSNSPFGEPIRNKLEMFIYFKNCLLLLAKNTLVSSANLAKWVWGCR